MIALSYSRMFLESQGFTPTSANRDSSTIARRGTDCWCSRVQWGTLRASERVTVSAVQSDLFAGPQLAGLTQAQGIVTQNEELALIASIDAVKLSPFRFHGWLG